MHWTDRDSEPSSARGTWRRARYPLDTGLDGRRRGDRRRPFWTDVTVVVLLGWTGTGFSDATPVGRAQADSAAATGEIAAALVATFDRIARDDLWPGFAPRRTPLAIFDGEHTVLFRHPSPGEGFRPLAGSDGVSVFDGRHPAVTANSSAEIDGVRTATLLLTADDASPLERAGTLIHETFHVYQRENHPTWSANEADLFTYPFADAELLGLRRLELAALRRALAASDPEVSACWARTALEVRSERFLALPAEAASYERLTELNEGLATYVERRATGALEAPRIESRGFGSTEVRQRGYETGFAWSVLLDRFSSGWQGNLNAGSAEPGLDSLLREALGERRRRCEIDVAERDRAGADAAREVGQLEAGRETKLRSFLDQPGWSVLVEAERAPLFPRGFDPLNVEVLGDGRVLHSRFVRLGRDGASIEVLDRAALTVAAGEHPLFNGVRSVRITGLSTAPSITEAEGRVRLSADGVHAELSDASVERSGSTLIVRLAAPR